MKKSIFFLSLAGVILLSSCATIICGSSQHVKFASNPSSATIYIDEVEVGTTPFEINLRRNTEHQVMIKLDGYQPYETTLTKSFNPWYLGNILIGGVIGLIIDPITGAIYNLTPRQVNAELSKGTAFKTNKKGIYIAVALVVDKNWKKVGQLEKLN
jgi:hypothetical protein